MQRLLSLLSSTMLFALSLCGQNNAASNRLGHCRNAAFDREVADWLSFSVPAIDVDSLQKMPAGVVVIDAREPAEYAISHLTGAINCGFKHSNLSAFDTLSKNRPIVIYCSIGYRSEKIAEKLKSKGFKNVSNLYGSIFEWVNRGYPVIDAEGRPTLKIHTYNKSWGKWVENANYERVY